MRKRPSGVKFLLHLIYLHVYLYVLIMLRLIIGYCDLMFIVQFFCVL